MAAAFLIGRLILGAYYLFSAYHHFSDTSTMAGFAAKHGVPYPTAAILISGFLLAIAGVTLLLGVLPRVGVLALVLFFLPVTFAMHPFWGDTNAAARMADLVNFTKNMALLGSSLMFLAIPEPWPFSLRRTVRWRVRARA
jgi:putative oxidoreductase